MVAPTTPRHDTPETSRPAPRPIEDYPPTVQRALRAILATHDSAKANRAARSTSER